MEKIYPLGTFFKASWGQDAPRLWPHQEVTCENYAVF